jgi:hypothetical protein
MSGKMKKMKIVEENSRIHGNIKGHKNEKCETKEEKKSVMKK